MYVYIYMFMYMYRRYISAGAYKNAFNMSELVHAYLTCTGCPYYPGSRILARPRKITRLRQQTQQIFHQQARQPRADIISSLRHSATCDCFVLAAIV